MKKNVVKKWMLAIAFALVLQLPMQAFAAGDRPDTILFGHHTEDQQKIESAAVIAVQPSKKYKFSTFKSWINQLKETNSDVIGWLAVPGTNINTVLVQSPTEKNNVYYNSRDWKKTNYPNLNYKNFTITSTFLDYRTIIGDSWRNSSRNTVIYGHNWTNLRDPFDIGENNRHVMFGQLPSYKDVNFATQNPYIYFSTADSEGIWKVFAAATCEVDRSFFYNNPNPTKQELESLIKEWKLRSDLSFDVDVQPSDKLLTLSTCIREYKDAGDTQRYVVVARLLRPDETDQDIVTVTPNTNKKIPVFPQKAVQVIAQDNPAN